MPRELRFSSVDDILAELDRLEAGPIRTTGTWSVAQILEHLTGGMLWAMNEDPGEFRGEAVIPNEKVARRFFDRMVKSGKMRAGVPNPNAPSVREERDPKPAFAAMRAALERFRDHQGPHPLHAFFGELTSEEWQQWNLIHCAHHLGFAEPG